MRHRQRCGHRPGRARNRDRGTGKTWRPALQPPAHQRNGASRPALPSPARRTARTPQGPQQDRHDQTRHWPRLRRQGRAHRPAADRPAPAEDLFREAEGAHGGKQRHPRVARRRAVLFRRGGADLPRGGQKTAPVHHQHRRLAAPAAREKEAHPLRGRAGAPSSTSISAPIRSSPRPTRRRAAPAPVRASRQTVSTMSSV